MDHWGLTLEAVADTIERIETVSTIVTTYMKENKVSELEGSFFSTECAAATSTTLLKTPTELLAALKEKGQDKLFDEVFKPQLGVLKKLLGEAFMRKISVPVTDAYARVKKPTRKS